MSRTDSITNLHHALLHYSRPAFTFQMGIPIFHALVFEQNKLESQNVTAIQIIPSFKGFFRAGIIGKPV